MIKQAANNLLHQIMSDFQTLNKKIGEGSITHRLMAMVRSYK